MASLYSYSPLDHNVSSIRLIKLLPGAISSSIHCEIIKSFLEDGIPYEALSYTWGSSEIAQYIHVENQPFRVTWNLFEALRYLRDPVLPRILWIDALSIDQSNLSERQHQVGQMGSIYRAAERVLVWLGPERGDSDIAMEIMSSVVATNSTAAPTLPSSKADCQTLYDSIQNLLLRPWFERVWVIQEVANARSVRVMCGTKSNSAYSFRVLPPLLKQLRASITGLPLDNVVKSPRSESELESESKSGDDTTATTMTVDTTTSKIKAVLDLLGKSPTEKRQWRNSIPLMQLVMQFIHCKASDPHDMVYALMGLSVDACDTKVFSADYTRDLQDVYLHAMSVSTGFLLRTSLSFLSYSPSRIFPATQLGALGKFWKETPTWMPDWTNDEFLNQCQEIATSKKEIENENDKRSSTHNHTDFRIIADQILKVDGIRLGQAYRQNGHPRIYWNEPDPDFQSVKIEIKLNRPIDIQPMLDIEHENVFLQIAVDGKLNYLDDYMPSDSIYPDLFHPDYIRLLGYPHLNLPEEKRSTTTTTPTSTSGNTCIQSNRDLIRLAKSRLQPVVRLSSHIVSLICNWNIAREGSQSTEWPRRERTSAGDQDKLILGSDSFEILWNETRQKRGWLSTLRNPYVDVFWLRGASAPAFLFLHAQSEDGSKSEYRLVRLVDLNPGLVAEEEEEGWDSVDEYIREAPDLQPLYLN